MKLREVKNRFKRVRRAWFFVILRWAERHLSVRTLCRLLKPLAFVRAALNKASFKNPGPGMSLPESLRVKWTWRLACQRRMSQYLNHYLECFPDRLGDAKWKDRCRIVGLDHLLKARQSGRPVVLAHCHFGPIFFMRPWLRANGLPSAALLMGKAKDRSELMCRTDRLISYPHIPTAFYLDQLKEAAEFLAAGNLLFVTIDVAAGKHMGVPFCEGWSFQMATGAMRLAVRHQAELIPCSIIDEGHWRFRIEVGQPVPREWLTPGSDWTRVGKHLLAEMIPHLQAHPEQCIKIILLSLRNNSSDRSLGKPNA